MAEYIDKANLVKRLESRIKDYGRDCNGNAPIISRTYQSVLHMVENLPTADVVSIEVFEQVKWERYTALKTLEEHGIGLGQKADVVEVKHGEWINEEDYLYKCSLCGDKAFLRLGGKPCKYCPNCGAKMDKKEGAEE